MSGLIFVFNYVSAQTYKIICKVFFVIFTRLLQLLLLAKVIYLLNLFYLASTGTP